MRQRFFRASCLLLPIAGMALLCGCGVESKTKVVLLETIEPDKPIETASESQTQPAPSLATDLAPPVRLEADGKPINIFDYSDNGHAGPWVADVDCDGDRDLLVGDFPGNFWFFANEYSDGEPKYAAGVKFQAGGTDAKVPVY